MSTITKEKYFQNFIKKYNINPENIDVTTLPHSLSDYEKVVKNAIIAKIQHWNHDCETRYSLAIPGTEKLKLEFKNAYHREPSPEEIGYMKNLVMKSDLLKDFFIDSKEDSHEWDPIKEFKRMKLL